MEYANLEKHAQRMTALARGEHTYGPKRLEAERSRIVMEMHRLLRGSINRMTLAKNLRSAIDEVQQHTLIAIHQAVESWDPEIATFSTHVHWQLMRELATLQHNLFPERRKIKVKHPIMMIELDRPCLKDQEDSCTIGDTFFDEKHEDDVEAPARRFIALHSLERVLSHSIARQMTSFCINNRDLGKIAGQRKNLMRNRQIFILRHFDLKTYEEIADNFGITRERVRQIIGEMKKMLAGHLPSVDADGRVTEATKSPPADIHASWTSLAAEFHANTGIDTRLVDRDVPFTTVQEPYSFAPAATVEVERIRTKGRRVVQHDAPVIEKDGAPLATTPRPAHQLTMSFDDPRDDVAPTAIIVTMPTTRVSQVSQVGRIAIAGLGIASAMMALPVAAQTSKALPPEAGIAMPTDDEAPAPTHAVPRATPRASRGQGGEPVGPLLAMDAIVTDRPSWGVRVAEFQSAALARSGWLQERKGWTWIHGLYPGYIAPDGRTTSHGVAFGPLSRGQAAGLCHEAERVQKTCSVVTFGKVREAQAAHG